MNRLTDRSKEIPLPCADNGLFNKETNHKNVIRLVGAERGQPAEPPEGQIGLEVSE